MRRPTRPLLVAAAAALALVACNGPDDPDVADADHPDGTTAEEVSGISQPCERAFEEAVASEAAGSDEAVDQLLLACEGLTDFEAAAQAHPEAIGDASDPAETAARRCETSRDPAVGESAVCQDLAAA